MHICEFCGKKWNKKRSKNFHQGVCEHNPNRRIPKNQYTKAVELGLEKPKLSESTRNKISDLMVTINKTRWTLETRKKHSESMKKAVLENPDSYSKNNVCGRVNIIEYNGHKLKGSWELKVAEWLDKNNISWESEVNPQNYFWDNGWHMYFPDFYLHEYNVYLEVKGYKRSRDESKWSQFKDTLVIIDSTIINKLDDFENIEHLIIERTFTPE